MHSQILLSVFVEAWVWKYSFYLTDMLGEHLTHLSAFDTKMINCMALGLQSQNSDRNQLGSDSPALKRISQSRSEKGRGCFQEIGVSGGQSHRVLDPSLLDPAGPIHHLPCFFS